MTTEYNDCKRTRHSEIIKFFTINILETKSGDQLVARYDVSKLVGTADLQRLANAVNIYNQKLTSYYSK